MKKGFTLAEILVTLAIIGVVAAISITTVVQDYKKTEAVSRLKKAYSDISRVLYQAAYYDGTPLTARLLSTMNARELFNRYWASHLRNPKLCNTAADCGYKNAPRGVQPWKTLDGQLFQYNPPQGGALTDILTDDNSRMLFSYGTGVVVFYPLGITATGDINMINTINVFLVDINGPKAPNILGRDVFMFEVDNGAKVQPFTGDNNEQENYRNDCVKGGKGFTCTAEIIRHGWAIKGDYPW